MIFVISTSAEVAVLFVEREFWKCDAFRYVHECTSDIIQVDTQLSSSCVWCSFCWIIFFHCSVKNMLAIEHESLLNKAKSMYWLWHQIACTYCVFVCDELVMCCFDIWATNVCKGSETLRSHTADSFCMVYDNTVNNWEIIYLWNIVIKTSNVAVCPQWCNCYTRFSVKWLTKNENEYDEY